MSNECLGCKKNIRSNAIRCTKCYLKYLSKSRKCIKCGRLISSQANKCRSCSKLGHGWPNEYYKRQSLAQKRRFENEEPWNKGKKLPYLQRENNGQWKGENAQIKTIHRWVKNHRGRQRLCEYCNTTNAKAYDWANKDHKYKRNLNDYIRLCRSCHFKYDLRNDLRKPPRSGTGKL